MADDEDHGDNRTADMKLDAEILKIVETYSEHDAESDTSSAAWRLQLDAGKSGGRAARSDLQFFPAQFRAFLGDVHD